MDILLTNNREELAKMGKTISSTEMLRFVEQCPEKDRWKIAALLPEMPIDTFSEVLEIAGQRHIDILKTLGDMEIVGDKLKELYHSAQIDMEALFAEIDAVEKSITKIDPSKTNFDDIESIELTTENLLSHHEELIHILDQSLKILWNSTQADLIERFSTIKERLQKSLYSAIGTMRDLETPPTGLYAILEKQLLSCYAGCSDDDSAMTGLRKLGIHSVEDYWELGLLNEVEERTDLAKQDHEKLLQEVKKSLEELGLKTVRDLKDAYIFSPDALAAYLEA